MSEDEGRGFAKRNGLHFFEASARSGKNVDEIFHTIANTISQKIVTGEIDTSIEVSIFTK